MFACGSFDPGTEVQLQYAQVETGVRHDDPPANTYHLESADIDSKQQHWL